MSLESIEVLAKEHAADRALLGDPTEEGED